jgi:diguanylate cyclase (GGDEF)-like protein/PAS domain S-box-containing protein
MVEKMWRNWEITQKAAIRIVIFYIIISSLWVLFTDFILINNVKHLADWIGTAKGWLFIIFSGLLFYKLIQKEIKAIIRAENIYRLIVENVFDLILVTDKNGNIEYGSPSLQTISGYKPEDYKGKAISDYTNIEEFSKLQKTFCNRKPNETEVPLQFILQHKDGRSVSIEGKGVPIVGKHLEVEHIIFLGQDISDKKIAERMLLESEERYRKLVEFSPETTLIHENGKIVYVNKAGLNLVGADNINQIIGKNVLDFVHQDDLQHAINRMKKVNQGISEISEYRVVRLDGTLIFVDILAFQTTYQGEQAVQVIVRDVTERKKAAEKVNYLAYYDSLTGIPNRNLLYKSLNEVVDRSKENKQIIAVMFLDLDRFKMINDTFGHSFGDLLLQKVTSRLSECLGENNKLFRYGGDEYVIVMENTKLSNVSQLAEKLIISLYSPLLIQDRHTYISTSIGISVFPKDGDNPEALIQNADTAMYLAKERGRNNYQYYSASLNIINNRKMEIENGIRKAIENEEFALYYQPQVDLVTKKIIGLEALIRWKHPKYGFIPPVEFISVAEETGLIVLIGNWVLKTACKQFKQWLEVGFPLHSIAVNVSALQFRDKNFINTVYQVLKDTKLESSYLELEITESVTRQVEEVTKIMKELKALGVHLSIDDFGTGYSSLNYLRHFPIDKLKIDKSFVDEINNNLNGEALVRTIIELGNSLGFSVIAEGVENEHQISFLKENKCYLGQGYYFAKPLPTEELENLIKKQISLL